MAAARCSPCDINFPSDRKKCLACDRPTWDAPSEDWDREWKVEVAKIRADRRRAEVRPIENIDAKPVEKNGQLFVAEQLLYDHEIDPLEDPICLVGGSFYELVDRRFADTTIPAWRIEPVTVGEDFERLPVLAENPPHGG